MASVPFPQIRSAARSAFRFAPPGDEVNAPPATASASRVNRIPLRPRDDPAVSLAGNAPVKSPMNQSGADRILFFSERKTEFDAPLENLNVVRASCRARKGQVENSNR